MFIRNVIAADQDEERNHLINLNLQKRERERFKGFDVTIIKTTTKQNKTKKNETKQRKHTLCMKKSKTEPNPPQKSLPTNKQTNYEIAFGNLDGS